MEECGVKCGTLSQCTGFQSNKGGKGYLDNDDNEPLATRVKGKTPATLSNAIAASWQCGLRPITRFTYYASGCGRGPYLHEMSGTMKECGAKCGTLSQCTGFQRNKGGKCYLDNDDNEPLATRVKDKTPTTLSNAIAASWQCGLRTITSFTYYASGCGRGPYLHVMSGTMEECADKCLTLSQCTGYQRNKGGTCYLDN